MVAILDNVWAYRIQFTMWTIQQGLFLPKLVQTGLKVSEEKLNTQNVNDRRDGKSSP